MTITIIHVSDNHSAFLPLPEIGDLIVHSGDMLPNASRGNKNIEYQFQTNWVIQNIENFKKWLGDRPLLFVSGNHDFIDPCKILRDNSIDATNISNMHYSFKDINFYGFPYIPYIAGEWAYECTVPEMQQEIRKLKDAFEKRIDILVCHAPLHGILDDSYGIKIGNAQMNDLLSYGLETKQLPRWLLHGHAHGGHGWSEIMGIQISNAATTVHTIHV